ncbi:MAG: hypothetical protein GFH27_549327n85 [Chloroflexi bacterium AL-W]|nr:hypothetical protein [Chloroflexi bacterium AL-N1]NOK69697.1 hypothetical protein [Chloroflexi bacterium AL-N10]NOK72244.1 hypothetical protein [Chloroflexi bacterium AL-N5]NOK85073.1 hypothetical protein [Chloroflexi bacterium AL-W]NOK91826.1 hypothetical protein [Chloroflexi bacterium AL-N15]
MEKNKQPSFVAIVAQMVLFVVLGTPMVAYLWEIVNKMLSFSATPTQMLLGLPVLIVFIAFVTILTSRIRKWIA